MVDTIPLIMGLMMLMMNIIFSCCWLLRNAISLVLYVLNLFWFCVVCILFLDIADDSLMSYASSFFAVNAR